MGIWLSDLRNISGNRFLPRQASIPVASMSLPVAGEVRIVIHSAACRSPIADSPVSRPSRYEPSGTEQSARNSSVPDGLVRGELPGGSRSSLRYRRVGYVPCLLKHSRIGALRR